MKKLTGLVVGVCLFFVGGATVGAQEKSDAAMGGPPKVIQIQREYIKPGRGGSMHVKTESAFVQAMTAAKWPTHYLAMDSLSGPGRALFITGYPSFEAWEKDVLATQHNPTLSAALDRANIADGDLVSEYDSSAYVYREDYSLRANSIRVAEDRYFEISRVVVKPGHRRDFEALVKLYISGYEKAVPDANWAMFQSIFGAPDGNVFLVFQPHKSMAEIDRGMGSSKQFAEAMGESGMAKLEELSAACIESDQTNLFAFNPKMSYIADEWVKADPSFWKPKMTATSKKAAAKPAQ